MGIIKNTAENNCVIAIWDMKETLGELIKLSDKYELPTLSNKKRKKEFLASRLLLNTVSPKANITYNEFGSPEIGHKKFISISHSKNLVAIALSNQQVGLDIEQISEKVLRLSSKFISENSHQDLTKEKATLIWCCKEAVFKWYEKGNVDFINDIYLSPFVLSEKGEIAVNFRNKKLILNYQKINNHYLVYVCK